MAAPAEKAKVSFCQKVGNSFAGFGNFLYSKKDVNGIEQTLVMGRNGNSWAKIGLFYICFYAFLAGFFAAMLAVFLTTITSPGEGAPKLTQYIANKPGLTLVNPILSQYDFKDQDTVNAFKEKVNSFLAKYDDKGYSEVGCNAVNRTGYPEGDKPCKFDYKTALGVNCTESTGYGMKNQKPCILVKMNKVYGWVPEGSSNTLKLECTNANVVNGGYLKAAMPFRGQKFYTNPIAVVQVEGLPDKSVDVQCQLVGDKIEVSDSYNPKRAFGKIEFSIPQAKTT